MSPASYLVSTDREARRSNKVPGAGFELRDWQCLGIHSRSSAPVPPTMHNERRQTPVPEATAIRENPPSASVFLTLDAGAGPDTLAP